MTNIQIGYWNYVENARHNVVTEGIAIGSLNEQIRHNVRTEDIGQQTVNESIRHNIQNEGIGWANARSNAVMASASMIQATAAVRQADTAQYKAQTDRMKSMSDIQYTVAKTTGQVIDNKINRMTTPAQVIQPYYNLIAGSIKDTVSIIGDVGKLASMAMK